jgi:hypothetical protein
LYFKGWFPGKIILRIFAQKFMEESIMQEATQLSSPTSTESPGEVVSIFVDYNHPLLQLKRALPWGEIREVMVRHWRAVGKNVDGKPGQSWPVDLYVPLLVLMIVKKLGSRDMEAYLAENAVARVFIDKQTDSVSQIRDHSNIARAYAALGKQGEKEINALIVKEAVRLGFGDPTELSADTTVQELPIGYPNEPGILRGLAQRCGRALLNLKKKGREDVQEALDNVQTVLKSVKEYHLFAKGKEEKHRILGRLVEETRELLASTDKVVEGVQDTSERVKQAAIKKLRTMKQVGEQLIPQILSWMSSGVVAQGKILHAGITQARAIVRNKSGKKVEFGLSYLINRIGGGYLFGSYVPGCPDESKMPLRSLSEYREIFGQRAAPELFVYDRGGCAAKTIKKLKKAGVKKVGIQPKGKGKWHVAEEDRQIVKSIRGMTEGSIGTLKTDKYGFNKPLERGWESLRAAGQRSLLSLNLNKFMRDVIASKSKQPMQTATA